MTQGAHRVLALLAMSMLWGAGDSSSAGDLSHEFTDLTGAYTAFWDRTRTLSEPERIAAFKAEFGTLLPEFYGEERFKGRDPKKRNERIAESFERFPQIRDEYIRTASSFQAMLHPAMESFRRSFPDMKMTAPIYLLHSLGEMDGGTRMFGDRQVLIFGVDVMVTAHDFDDEQPFLHHELFHVHHEPLFPSCDEVWCALWTEGLAVHVAHVLNPSASDSQLLLTVPEPIPPQVDRHLEEAVCAVRSRLSSKEEADLKALFSFERLSPTIPPRAGYYVGYLAAQKAAASHSLEALAKMPPPQARKVVEEALRSLAKCE